MIQKHLRKHKRIFSNEKRMYKTIMKHWNSLWLNYLFIIHKMKQKKFKITLILPATGKQNGI